MCMKFHLSCFPKFLFMPESANRKCAGNVICPGSGNVPEILPYTVSGNVKEMSEFPGVENVHDMSKKCELSCTFHGISLPKKFRISSSVDSIRV